MVIITYFDRGVKGFGENFNKPKISTVDSISRNKKYMGVYHYNGIEIT